MKRTIYAVTNRRALIIASTTTSFDADDLSLITRRDHLDGRSDLLFNAGRLGDEEFGFLNITNPREVEGHLHRVETSPVN